MFLGDTVVGIAVGDIGDECDKHPVVVFNAGLVLRLRRFNTTADLAPEVEFPREIEASPKDTKCSRRKIIQSANIVAQLIASKPSICRLRLWKQATDFDVVGRARSKDAKASITKREILVVGFENQTV